MMERLHQSFLKKLTKSLVDSFVISDLQTQIKSKIISRNHYICAGSFLGVFMKCCWPKQQPNFAGQGYI